MEPGEVGRPRSWFVTSWTKGGGVFEDPMMILLKWSLIQLWGNVSQVLEDR